MPRKYARRGETHQRARLTTVQVLAIRAAAGLQSISKLARKYGVDRATIRKILRGKSWRHLLPKRPSLQPIGLPPLAD